MPARPERPSRKKQRATRVRRAPRSIPETEPLEKPVASKYLPQFDRYAVTMESGKTVLLSKDEIMERTRQAVLREMNKPEPLRKAKGRRWQAKLGSDPFVVEVGRHSVRRLYDLAVEALDKVGVQDRSAAAEIADHLWRGAAVPCRAEIAGARRIFFPWRYLVPMTAGPEGLPVERPWEEALPRFRAAVEEALRTPMTTIDPALSRGKKKRASRITICVLAEFGKDFSERSLRDVTHEYLSPLPIPPLRSRR